MCVHGAKAGYLFLFIWSVTTQGTLQLQLLESNILSELYLYDQNGLLFPLNY
jgi:hypothetical protein